MEATWFQGRCSMCRMDVIGEDVLLPYKEGEPPICAGCAHARQTLEARSRMEIMQSQTLGEKHMQEVGL
jgi:hypothetical protein